MRHLSVLLGLVGILELLIPSIALAAPQETAAKFLDVTVIEPWSWFGEHSSIPNVPVHRIPRRALPEIFENDLHRNLTAALTAAEVFDCDADGRCKMPRPTEDVLLFVWTESHFGYMTVRPEETAIKLVANTYRLVRVEVVDTEGQPIFGVPIELTDSYGSLLSFRSDPIRAGKTGADGRANLLFFNEARGLFIDDKSCFARVGLASVTTQRVKLEEDDDQILSGRYIMPAHGTLKVRFHPHPGLTVPRGRLDVMPSGGDSTRSAASTINSVEVNTGSTTAVVEILVGLEHEFFLHYMDSSAVGHLSQKVVGPVRAGETRVHDFNLPPRTGQFRLRGRLLRADGQTLNEKTYGLQFHGGLMEGRIVHPDQGHWTDAAGHFDLPLDLVRDADSAALEIQFCSGPAQAYFTSRRFEIDPQETEVLDLGDIVLLGKPCVVRGRVVDDQGRGIPAAELRVKAFGPDTIMMGQLTPMGGSFHSDADGRFEFRSDEIHDLFLLEVAKAGFQALSMNVTVGNEDLEVRLEATSRFFGKVVLVDQHPRFRDEIEIEIGVTNLERLDPVPAEHAFGNRVSAQVRPGSYRLRFRLRGAPDLEIHEPVVVELQPGEEFDLGTVELKLPGKLCSLRIPSTNPFGFRSGPCQLRIFADGETEAGLTKRAKLTDGAVYFLVDALPVAVELRQGDAVLPRLKLQEGYAEINPRPSTFLRLQLEGLEDLPDEVVVSCHLEDDWRIGALGMNVLPEVLASANPVAWFRIHAAGDFEIVAKLGLKTGDQIDWEPIHGAAPYRFEVLTDDIKAEASLSLERAPVLQALARLRSRQK